jgi:chemotaxis protein methyltransferase CheR
VMAPTLKQHITFADHSLATDSIFSEVQLVSCRNVLIYFARELQDRALGLFNDALCRRGFLCLGSKESVRFSAHSARFQECSAEHKIYRRVD